MDISLPKEILQSLPAPDDEGLVRVNAALKIGPDGKAEIVSINDKPLPTDDSGDGGDDASPAANLPGADKMDLGDDGGY